jgi:hypothetical protein
MHDEFDSMQLNRRVVMQDGIASSGGRVLGFPGCGD